jgi:hypothetical protein
MHARGGRSRSFRFSQIGRCFHDRNPLIRTVRVWDEDDVNYGQEMR